MDCQNNTVCLRKLLEDIHKQYGFSYGSIVKEAKKLQNNTVISFMLYYV